MSERPYPDLAAELRDGLPKCPRPRDKECAGYAAGHVRCQWQVPGLSTCLLVAKRDRARVAELEAEVARLRRNDTEAVEVIHDAVADRLVESEHLGDALNEVRDLHAEVARQARLIAVTANLVDRVEAKRDALDAECQRLDAENARLRGLLGEARAAELAGQTAHLREMLEATDERA